MNKKFLVAGMAAAMAATMLPSIAFADEQPTVTLLVPEYNAGKSLKNEGSDEVIKKVQEYTGINFEIKWGDNGAYDQVLGLRQHANDSYLRRRYERNNRISS